MGNPGKARCHAVFTAWHLNLFVHLAPRRGFTPRGGINFDSPAAKQQKRKMPKGIFLFCDYPQVLLFAPSHIARKGECEGETFAGFPTRVQSPARRRPILRSKIAAPQKYDHPKGGRIFLVPRRGFTPQGGINFDSPAAKQQKRTIPKGIFLFWCLVGDSNPGHPA